MNSLKKFAATVAAVALTFTGTAFCSVIAPSNSQLSLNSITASATTVTNGGAIFDFSYYNNDPSCGIRITNLISTNSPTVSIPSSVTVNGKSYPVIAIDDEFAMNVKNIRSIYIPDSVIYIGGNFAAGSSIESVSIGKNVYTIDFSFCANCKNLRIVSYSGGSLTKLEFDAFKNTPFINNANSKNAVTMGDWLIKYKGNASNVKVSDLGNGKIIRKIGPKAFDGNTSIKSVDLTGITGLEYASFRNCSSLSNISGGYSLNYVASNVFDNTSWLYTSLKNSNTAKIGKTLIKYEPKINSSVVDLRNKDIENIASQALFYLDETTLYLPSSVKNIDRNAFHLDGFSNFKNIYINNTKITFSNYSYYPTIKNNMAAFSNTIWGMDMAYEKGKQILKELDIPYVGSGDKANYTPWQQYQIINKLYHYVGKNYKYCDSNLGGSKNFIHEMFDKNGMVCVTYANLYRFLLELGGVNAETVNGGNYDSSIHEYNIVQVGKDWFFVDVCWYSPNNNNLFMVNQEVCELQKSCHILHSMNINEKYFTDMNTLYSLPRFRYTLGDVNRDGMVNIVDISTLKNHLSKKNTLSEAALVLADVNKDGRVDQTDLTTLRLILNK